jgi:SAM-dependent methyltransferase
VKQHIFVHIPKTAGSSVRTLLDQNYPAPVALAFSGDVKPLAWYQSLRPYSKRHYALLHGHFPYGIHEGLSQYVYFTFFRDPVARHFSDYDFLRRFEPHPIHDEIVERQITADDWARVFERHDYYRDLTTRYISGELERAEVDRLALEKAKLHLRREFAVAGLVDKFDESVLILARRLGWHSPFYLTRNVTSERTQPTATMRATAEQYLQRDLELYSFAQELFDQLPERRSAEFQDALAEFRDARAWLETFVTNNPHDVFVVGEEQLPMLDDIVKQHRATPALDKFLNKSTGAAVAVPPQHDSAENEPRGSGDPIEWAANRVRHSLLVDPPQVLPTLPMMTTIGSRTKEHYLANMREYTHDIITRTRLLPTGHVLDIGCGCGRVATGLARYLDEGGAYLGFDVWKEGIDWCNANLTRFPAAFSFETVPATNNYYYAEDNGVPNTFDVSGVPSNEFHCIFALSVFTHLKLADARQYLDLVARALTADGLAYLTFFVVDDDARGYVAKTGNHTGLKPAGDGMWYGYAKQDFFSGYEPDLLFGLFEEYGLEIEASTPGSWAQKPNARLYQDWFLLKRRG